MITYFMISTLSENIDFGGPEKVSLFSWSLFYMFFPPYFVIKIREKESTHGLK